MTIDFSFLARYQDALLMGLGMTLRLTLIAFALGIVWGFVLALLRNSSIAPVRWIAAVYVEFFRGTPVLIQIFWIFYCMPIFLGTDLSNFTAAVLCLTLYGGAIMSETFRAGMKSIGREQYDACHALGLSPWTRATRIVLPQATLRSVPVLLSNGIGIFKESSLVSAIGMMELMFIGTTISNRTGRPVEVFTAVALIYFVVAFPLTRLVTWLEKRILKRFAI
ncbi:amino acid ABC transporter membrane protein 2, PAAT family [Paracoccus solventivorans]|uniref:Glutamate/aspartate import permease protein GltK n=1 Tax=Paracoccus solventivorans TaxID=53463 RepID=A0A1M7FHZ1_9RHOB|nr:amino acid ABC transporter permease [Paracoccus solventivorans]SHM03319.1 amino acid ABC transporter membrane protein 2, PAAT family [Paracoccus solventivorans]HHW33641.1 amino acid ABC transporter permease [Paracoccus solventivorans]HMM08267.1 amino acid ABC transporter permease [Paracoccus solventivorans]